MLKSRPARLLFIVAVVLGLLALPAMISAQNVTPTVTVTQNDTLGSFLADGNGMTLYLFLKDEPGVTNCYGTCAENWPPLLVEGDPVAGDGVDAAMLGTTERTDGAIQVTYNGWPLYYYAKDVAPGDTVGQEVGDVWYVVSPAGEQIPPAAAAAAEVAATEAMTETTAMTDTMAMTDTAAMTETMAMTDTAAMAETEAMTDTTAMAAAEAMTETMAMTDTTAMAETAAMTDTETMTDTTAVAEEPELLPVTGAGLGGMAAQLPAVFATLSALAGGVWVSRRRRNR